VDEDEEKRRLRRCLVRSRDGRVAVVRSIVVLSSAVGAISIVQLKIVKIQNWLVCSRRRACGVKLCWGVG
jgi:hypothetical protein